MSNQNLITNTTAKSSGVKAALLALSFVLLSSPFAGVNAQILNTNIFHTNNEAPLTVDTIGTYADPRGTFNDNGGNPFHIRTCRDLSDVIVIEEGPRTGGILQPVWLDICLDHVYYSDIYND